MENEAEISGPKNPKLDSKKFENLGSVTSKTAKSFWEYKERVGEILGREEEAHIGKDEFFEKLQHGE